MHPAFSVIFLTTLIGAGQGLFVAIYAAQWSERHGWLAVGPGRDYVIIAALVSMALTAGGLAASFFHLGRPGRAWRSAAKWRTSWLSREVIVLPAFMGVVFLFGVAHLLDFRPVFWTLPSGVAIDATVVLGLVATVLAFSLFVCTAMIYACLPFLREWASPLTVANFILLGGASGFTLAAVFSGWVTPDLTPFIAGWAIVLTLLGFASRVASLVRNQRLRPKSTPQTALGIKHPRIVQKSMGFMGRSFNTQELFHGRTPLVLRSVKWVFLLAAFAVPLVLPYGRWP